jgi:acyl-CoA synthetase (AMP-forming)/AMP-acid ligase II
MGATPGHIYSRLAEAVARSGAPRSVYSQDTTLSRRGLMTRAERRARELAGLGVRPGQIVALSMGNVVEFLVLLLASSKLGAIAMPVDPANGDRTLLDAAARLPLRAVVRRPRGSEATALDYPDGYGVCSRRRLTSSLLTVDVLDPPEDLAAIACPPGAEVVLEARGRGGVLRDTFRGGEQLAAIGRAAVAALGLDEQTRLLCGEPLVVARFFDPVVLGWLASEAQLVMAEGPALQSVLPIARNYDRLVVIDSVRQFVELARDLKASGSTLPLQPVIPQATVPLSFAKPMRQAFGVSPKQLLLLEEVGLLASRTMERSARFDPPPGVELCSGDAMEVGGNEILARSDQLGVTLPAIGPGEPAAPVDDADFIHTGYAGRFGRGGELGEVIGRDDGLVNLEGRRACLDRIEDVMLEHRRLTWVRALLEHTDDGDPTVTLEYEATGTTEVDDIEEHAIGHLPPFMVPREFKRVERG